MYDYYKILEIKRTASLKEIKKAYRDKAKAFHPDINNSPKANEYFAIVNEAYSTLCDETKRYVHDAQLNYADTTKADAERKKQYYGSSVKNNTYTNKNSNHTSANNINFHYHWNSFGNAGFKEKTDEDFFKQSPVLYNMLFICGMFLGFLIAIVSIVGTFNNYWPKPFILLSILGFILIRQGWKGILGKQTIFTKIRKGFKK